MNPLAILWESRALLASGAATTVSLVLICVAVGLPLAAVGHVALEEASPPLRRLGRGLMDGLRCVPFLLLAYVIYYGLPEIGVRLPAFWTGLVSLAVYHTAYFIEIFRSAALSLPRDGVEAASAFGFSRARLYWRIIMPQLLLAAAPMIGNQVIMIVKDSALLMIITVQELTFAANFVSINYFSPFAPLAFAMVAYWLLSLAVELIIARIGAARKFRYG